jgi:hypothetical protein
MAPAGSSPGSVAFVSGPTAEDGVSFHYCLLASPEDLFASEIPR